LTKLFVSCTKLEELDISNFLNVGDDEIRLLAQNCPNMAVFKAVDSPHISDQSILALSQHCSELDCIDVSRKSYSFKISDVSLLALGNIPFIYVLFLYFVLKNRLLFQGKRAFSLRSLILNGCENVTDVGLNWLVEGCHSLEELNLCGCTRVILRHFHST